MSNLRRIITGSTIGTVASLVVSAGVAWGLWYYGHFSAEYFYPIASGGTVLGSGGGGFLGYRNPFNWLREELPVSSRNQPLLESIELQDTSEVTSDVKSMREPESQQSAEELAALKLQFSEFLARQSVPLTVLNTRFIGITTAMLANNESPSSIAPTSPATEQRLSRPPSF